MISTSNKGNVFVAIRRGTLGAVLVTVLSIVLGSGCDKYPLFGKPDTKSTSDADRQQELARKTAPLPGTIGSACYFEGLQGRVVQGYGLVMGLGDKGSSQCPAQVRDLIVESLQKNRDPNNPLNDTEAGKSIQAMIDSTDTAAVWVSGIIPPGAFPGESFDVVVRALPDTGTISLEGGWLAECDLRIVAGEKSAKSRLLARAAGPVSIDPFEKRPEKELLTIRREGFILGGGVNLEPWTVLLLLRQPSYPQARAIEQKINSVFGSGSESNARPARAKTAGRIDLYIPSDYTDNKPYFLKLVENLYIRSDPAYIEQQARNLTQEITDPSCNAEAISYAWETMGRAILPLIQPLYNHSNLQAAFYAARAGAALGDSLATDRLGEFATKPDSDYRQKAIKQLGFCRQTVARRILRNLLDEENTELRLLAYEGLARNQDNAITSETVGNRSFMLHVVSSKERPMVYVTRSNRPKVVLFGNISIVPPVFYCHPDDSTIISADSGATELSVIHTPAASKLSMQGKGPLDLADLLRLLGGSSETKDKKAAGMGLAYSQIMAILSDFCEKGTIRAKFQLEKMADLPDRSEASLGRPEQDE